VFPLGIKGIKNEEPPRVTVKTLGSFISASSGNLFS